MPCATCYPINVLLLLLMYQAKEGFIQRVKATRELHGNTTHRLIIKYFPCTEFNTTIFYILFRQKNNKPTISKATMKRKKKTLKKAQFQIRMWLHVFPALTIKRLVTLTFIPLMIDHILLWKCLSKPDWKMTAQKEQGGKALTYTSGLMKKSIQQNISCHMNTEDIKIECLGLC